MNEEELVTAVKKYRNHIIDQCKRVVGWLEDERCNLPWDDFSEDLTGYYKALQDAQGEIEKLRIGQLADIQITSTYCVNCGYTHATGKCPDD